MNKPDTIPELLVIGLALSVTYDDIQGQPLTPETVAAAVKKRLDELGTTQTVAAGHGTAARPLTAQDLAEAGGK